MGGCVTLKQNLTNKMCRCIVRSEREVVIVGDNNWTLLDRKIGDVVAAYETDDNVYYSNFDCDEKYIVASTNDCAIHIWKTSPKGIVSNSTVELDAAVCAFNMDNNEILVGTLDTSLHTLSPNTLSRFSINSNEATEVAFDKRIRAVELLDDFIIVLYKHSMVSSIQLILGVCILYRYALKYDVLKVKNISNGTYLHVDRSRFLIIIGTSAEDKYITCYVWKLKRTELEKLVSKMNRVYLTIQLILVLFSFN